MSELLSKIFNGSGSSKKDSHSSPAGLRTDGYLLSRRTAGSRSDGCGNPKGPGVKQTKKSTKSCSIRPTSFYIMTFCDGQDTGTDGDYRCGYLYHKHSTWQQTDNSGSGTGVGAKDAGSATLSADARSWMHLFLNVLIFNFVSSCCVVLQSLRHLHEQHNDT